MCECFFYVVTIAFTTNTHFQKRENHKNLHTLHTISMKLHGICIAFPMPIILKHKTGGKEEATSIKWETVNAIEKQYIHGHKIKKNNIAFIRRKCQTNLKTFHRKQAHEQNQPKKKKETIKKELPENTAVCSSAVLLLYLFIFLTFIRRICRFSTHFMWMFTCIFWATVYAIPLMIPLSFSSLSLSLYLYLYLKIASMKNLFRKKSAPK